jgi:hypothetical protein
MAPMVMMMSVSDGKVESDYRPWVKDRPRRAHGCDIDRSRNIDRRGLRIHRRRLHVNGRGLHNHRLRDHCRVLHNYCLHWLLDKYRCGLINDGRGLHVNGRRCINRLRLECFGQEQASSNSGQDFAGYSPFFVPGVRARRGKSDDRQRRYCCYGSFHTITIGFDARSELLFSKRFPRER